MLRGKKAILLWFPEIRYAVTQIQITWGSVCVGVCVCVGDGLLQGVTPQEYMLECE